MPISRVWFAFILSLAPLSLSNAFSTKVEDAPNLNPLHIESVELISSSQTDTIAVGSQSTLKFKLQLDEGFHAYNEQFKLELIGPPGFYVSEPSIKPLVQFHDPISKKTKLGAENYFELTTLFEVEPTTALGSYQLEFRLTYQACGKDFCLLPKKLPVVHKIKVTGDKPTTFTTALNQGWLYALLFVFLAGILTSFTPCIFPMIPITLAVIGSKSEHSRWRGFIISLFYVLGIAFTYSALGLFAAKSGMLFGSYLGHPFVVAIISGVFILMALSLFDVFEIKAPQLVVKKLAGVHTKKNLLGAFLSGLIAGVVASPCVGPVLIGILTYVAQSQDLFKGFILLFTFALGLGQIFLVLGTFHSFLHKIPRSGPWMNHVKKVFGVIMLGMAVYYAYPVLKKPINEFSTKYLGGFSASFEEKYPGPNWQTYSDAALEQAPREKKPVIIDFHAEWCVACKELVKYTFSDSRVIELGQQFVWLSFDATEPSPELDRLQKKYGIGGLPFVVLYNVNGEAPAELYLTGFEKADAFLVRMRKMIAAN